MLTFEYTIKDPLGIHARPAGLLVKEANKFKPDTTVTMTTKEGRSSDVTRLMNLMALAFKCGDTVTLTIEGGDEEAAKAAIEAFLEANL